MFNMLLSSTFCEVQLPKTFRTRDLPSTSNVHLFYSMYSKIKTAFSSVLGVHLIVGKLNINITIDAYQGI